MIQEAVRNTGQPSILCIRAMVYSDTFRDADGRRYSLSQYNWRTEYE